MNHKVGDLLYDPDHFELCVLVKIWDEQEIKYKSESYADYRYEVYFPETGDRDRFRDVGIQRMKRALENALRDEG